MVTVLDPRHLHESSRHPFWLIVTAAVAFLLAVLWARPVG